ncbi:hypothetical protein ACR1PO_15755 [Chryseobacterium sp. RRHN12]|uniref:hypothetical protein n=1 Tax=Chryseobacterium sp. RRHN12 TaxID=3437884 RepID=UPI003D9B2760
MGCNNILFYDKPYIEKDIRSELYNLLFSNEYPSYNIRQIENIESNGFFVESISLNGPTFVFVDAGEDIGEIQYVHKTKWKNQIKIDFRHNRSNMKFILVLDYLKK